MSVYQEIERKERSYLQARAQEQAAHGYHAKIKLCGLTRECDIAQANELLVDYIGLVFAPRSKRYVSAEQAAALKAKLRPEIQAVGVFVDADPAEIVKLYAAGTIDVVQLHGHEDEIYLGHLRQALANAVCERQKLMASSKFPTCPKIFKAFSVKTEADVALAQASSADFVLLDAGAGGTGKSFDWELASRCTRPYFLAGGLDPQNVVSAISALHPYGVDVSSGIESEGLKDLDKMRAFVTGVRSAS